jgi:hypothetical protein
MTLREAAERTSRSITTLRRYIRSGRLKAEKENGRYGPEYLVSTQDLAQAGLSTEASPRNLPEVARDPSPAHQPAPPKAGVPISLYRELQMKHEQLLVQYGMMRAGGLRALELQADLEDKRRQVDDAQSEMARLKDKLQRERSNLRRRLREAELELEGRRLQIAALREKVRGLEMLTRNAVTTETIERQFLDVVDQIQRVDRLGMSRDPAPSKAPTANRGLAKPDPEH